MEEWKIKKNVKQKVGRKEESRYIYARQSRPHKENEDCRGLHISLVVSGDKRAEKGSQVVGCAANKHI